MLRNCFAGLVAVLMLAACGGDESDTAAMGQMDDTSTAMTTPAAPAASTQPAASATATLRDAQGTEVGTVTLTQEGTTVRFSGELRGLPPGEHGFHVHQVGLCEPPSFETAGDHFNPTNASHGTQHPEGPHAGDLPNLQVGDDGTVQVNAANDLLSLQEGQPNSVFDADGSALVVHADPDDYQSQPSGNAGDRIACGVIEAA